MCNLVLVLLVVGTYFLFVFPIQFEIFLVLGKVNFS